MSNESSLSRSIDRSSPIPIPGQERKRSVIARGYESIIHGKSSSEEDEAIEAESLVLISDLNKDKVIFSHYPYPNDMKGDDFTRGFFEAMDFMQYITCYFSIAVAHELWPPRSDYEKDRAFETAPDGSKTNVLKYNHFWNKYQKCITCPECETRDKTYFFVGAHEFYESLDYNNRGVLYTWYKRSVNKRKK